MLVRRSSGADGVRVLRWNASAQARRGRDREAGGRSAAMEGRPAYAREVHLPRLREGCLSSGALPSASTQRSERKARLLEQREVELEELAACPYFSNRIIANGLGPSVSFELPAAARLALSQNSRPNHFLRVDTIFLGTFQVSQTSHLTTRLYAVAPIDVARRSIDVARIVPFRERLPRRERRTAAKRRRGLAVGDRRAPRAARATMASVLSNVRQRLSRTPRGEGIKRADISAPPSHRSQIRPWGDG